MSSRFQDVFDSWDTEVKNFLLRGQEMLCSWEMQKLNGEREDQKEKDKEEK